MDDNYRGSPMTQETSGDQKMKVPGLVNVIQKTMENHHAIYGKIHELLTGYHGFKFANC